MKRPSPPPTPQPPPKPFLIGALAASLFILHLALGLRFIGSAAPTYDEPVHLASGYAYLATGIYRLNAMDHPPLGEMWAALPLLRWSPNLFRSHPDWSANRVYHYADTFLYRNKVPAERMLNAARRWSLIGWSALFFAALFAWGARLGGPAAALGALFAFVFQPVLSSNLALVTTDAASAAFFFLTFFLLAREVRGRGVWLAAGACAGLALASKFNMILLPPLAALLLVLEHRLRPAPRPRFPWLGVLLAAAAALLALAAVYRFASLPVYGEGLSATLARLERGRATFLHGSRTLTGSPLFFPTALALKTPLALLLLALGAAFVRFRKPGRELLWVLGPALVYFAAALSAKVQIGVRHLLPVLPFLALLAGWALGELWKRPWKGRLAAAVLAAWAAVSVLRAGPHSLAYFNELAGGPAGGWRWLVDSSLDWGQDLKGLGAWLREQGGPPVYLSYFGTADPADYGIRYVPVGFITNCERPGDAVDPAASGRVLFAVSATNLQGTYFEEQDLFGWLKRREPLKVFGHALFLYDLSSDAEGRAALRELVVRAGRPDAAGALGAGGPGR
ncbi:MAG: glycosyltransferase family 39 protein [Elusimicrobiota bacterium]